MMKRLALFASGSGTNVQNIAEYFSLKPEVEISLILSNKPDAYVLKRAEKLGIASMVFDREDFYQSDKVVKKLEDLKVDLLVLAGFLWLIPENLLKAFSGRIINIHPALLPKYGGKGMYGGRVHQAVMENKEKETGISIHFVNERYDEGELIFQKSFDILPGDTIDEVEAKVHALEYECYPKVIEEVLAKQ